MIGIFDSGIGGLTVVKEIFKHLPDYQLVYFGDTARTPYGNKSKETILKYAIQNTDFLLSKGAKIIIIACNSASAVAADKLKKHFPNTPIFEVITPAVEQAAKISKNKKIGVIGTRATIASNIYKDKISTNGDQFEIFGKACPLFVPLAEEGMLKKPVTKLIAKQYLYPIKLKNIDTLILGCTHYPMLKSIIQEKIGKKIKLVDPAEQTTLKLSKFISENKELENNLDKSDNHQFYFSDLSPHLSELAQKWLDKIINPILYSPE